MEEIPDSPRGPMAPGGPRPGDADGGASFWGLLPRAFAYPLRGEGRWMIFGGGVGLCLAELASRLSPLAGLILQIALLAYFATFALRNVAASAGGAPEPPGWPDISSLDDTVEPLVLIVGSFALSLLPFIGYRLYFWIAGQSPNSQVSTGLWIAGLVYLPMALLAVSLRDSLSGLNPLVVLPAIAKVLPAYLVALVAIGAACALYYPLGYLASIPLLGSLLGAMLGVYWLMVVTHIIGLIYRGYAKRLNWFPEE